FGQLEPGVRGKQMHEPLADEPCRAEHAGPELAICGRAHDSGRIGAHARSPFRKAEASGGFAGERLGEIRVPRACGLKVLRTQTTIWVSAANGNTSACSTFAPA